MFKGLSILLGICFVMALFIILVLYVKFEKEEKKHIEEQLKQMEADTEKIKKQNEKYVQEKKENEELVQKINGANNLDSADASVELLQKLSDKGKERNKH